MAPIAARKLMAVAENTTNVLAIEIMAAYQALGLGKGLAPGRGVAAAVELIGHDLPPLTKDRYLKRDVDVVRKLMDDGRLLDAVRKAVPELS